jgi:16S rRNA C1402 (ribose-2'-O) methylase RsmI
VLPVGDACGWVTELKHRPQQIVFCETPARVHELLERLLG